MAVPTTVIKGKNAVFSMLVSGSYYPVFCCKSFELVQEQVPIEVTSVNSGSDTEWEAGMSTANVECSGVATVDNTGGQISVTYLQQQAVRRVLQDWRITLTADNATVLVYSFSGIILRTGVGKQSGVYLGSNVSVRVSGALQPDVIIPPPVPEDEFVLYLGVVADENSVSDAALLSATILQVQREGTGHTEVGGTPTPGGREFNYTVGGGVGTITFDVNQPFNAGEIIYILYRT